VADSGREEEDAIAASGETEEAAAEASTSVPVLATEFRCGGADRASDTTERAVADSGREEEDAIAAFGEAEQAAGEAVPRR
jgi:hypothetical protein